MNILYVEDEPLDSEMVKREFARNAPQHTVKVAATYRAALTALESSAAFDLVLTDYHLPDGDGLGLLAHIRARALPFAVVMITGAGDEETAVAVMKAGADDYVVKRGDYAARLPMILEDALAHYRAQAVHRTRPLRVLYAEHNTTDVDLTRRHLAAHAPHIHLDVVNSAAEALKKLSTQASQDEYDVVLLDYRLPGSNALEMLKELRQTRRLDIPIVLVTGTGSDEVALQALKLGAADYVVKNEGYLLRLPGALENAFHFSQLRREQIALRESEERYRKLIETSPDGISIVGLDGRISYVSPKILEMYGYQNKSEIIGNMAVEWVAPEDRERAITNIGNVFKGIYVSNNRYQLVRKDGSRFWGEINSAILADAQGKPGGLIAITRDITEQVQAEEALQESEANLKEAQVLGRIGNWAYDVENNTLDWSAQAYALYERDPALGPPTPEEEGAYYAPEQAQILREYSRRAISEGKEFEYDLQATLPSRKQIYLSATMRPLKDEQGRVIRLFGTVQDITERKQRERELEAIANVSTALRVAQTRAEMLPIILDQLMILLNADGAAFEILDLGTGEVILEQGRGIWGDAIGDHIPAGKGLTAQVLATHQPYLNNDVRNDPQLFRPDLIADCNAVAGVPLVAQERIIGLLWVARQTDITDGDVRLLTAIADIAANAIHRATLHEQTERQVKYLAALHTIDLAISNSIDLRVTLNILLEHVLARLGVDAATVLLVNPLMHTLDFAAARGFRGSGITRLSLRLGEDYAGKAALERCLVSVPNLKEAEQPFSKAHLTAGENFIAYYAAPLIAKGRVKGVLEVFHRSPLRPDSEWLDFFQTLAGQAAIAIENAKLFEELQRSNTDLMLSYDTTLEGWSRALDLRDKETEGHTQRVTEKTERLARAMGMSDAELVHVRRGALLHDIGKMGVPDSILLKSDKLTDEEWVVMRRHPQLAYEMLAPIAFLRRALDVPYCHHEKWDGTGYPRGLKGEQIPLAARIFAIVDVWDALRSDRPYRKAWNEDQVREYLREQSGKHFDPQVVERFLSMEYEQ